MKKSHKYNKGQTVYKIKWKRNNGYTIDGCIEACTILKRFRTKYPAEPWYYLETADGKEITEMENYLYETERKAKEAIQTRIENNLERLENTYQKTKLELINRLNNITNELA